MDDSINLQKSVKKSVENYIWLIASAPNLRCAESHRFESNFSFFVTVISTVMANNGKKACLLRKVSKVENSLVK